jgi:hypothetical protein
MECPRLEEASEYRWRHLLSVYFADDSGDRANRWNALDLRRPQSTGGVISCLFTLLMSPAIELFDGMPSI